MFGALSRLVAMFPAAKIPPRLFAPFLYAGFATPELRRGHANAMAKVSARTLRARVAAILSVDHSQLLRRISVPMMYLRARQDRLIPRSAFNKIDRLRPDIQLLQTLSRPAAEKVAEFRRFVKSGELHAPEERS